MRVCGGKNASSSYFSISGLFSDKGGEGGMSRNKGVLRSLCLQSNSSLLLSGALRLWYLWDNSSSFDSIIGHQHRFYQFSFLTCLV